MKDIRSFFNYAALVLTITIIVILLNKADLSGGTIIFISLLLVVVAPIVFIITKVNRQKSAATAMGEKES